MSELAENVPTQESAVKNKNNRKILIFCLVSMLNVAILTFILIQLLSPATHSVTDPLVGHPAPNFTLVLLHNDSDKNILSLSNLKGKPIVLNFWASWC